MSFDKKFDVTAGRVYFYFNDIHSPATPLTLQDIIHNKLVLSTAVSTRPL